ncbi:MAG: proton-conducting transporter membrane subunit [Nitrospinota bacterium]|nr:proton-conducting transporter membrane subunit [Nitrospinota bacterium]
MKNLLPIFVILPLITGILTYFLGKKSKMQENISFISLFINFILSAFLFFYAMKGTIFTHQMGLWPFPYGIILIADRLTSTMLCISSSIVGISVLYSKDYFPKENNLKIFHPLIHFLLMGIQGCFLTGDLFNLFVFFEVLLISAYALLACYHSLEQLEMSFKFTCINLVASALFLTGISFIYAQVGTVNMADLSLKLTALNYNPMIITTALIFVLVFSVKGAIFPMQLWLPSAHSIAPTPVSAILAGVLVKVGIYAIIRCQTLIFIKQFFYFQNVLIFFAIITIFIGAFGTLPQKNLKRILAYSTINQLGFISLGIAFLSVPALTATIFFIVVHSYLKSSVLLAAGLNYKITGTENLDEMGGMMKKTPFLSILLLISFLSLAGIPPLSGFFAKILIFKAGFSSGFTAITSVALFLGIISLFYNFKTYQRMAWGEAESKLKKASSLMYVCVTFLTLFAIFFGLGASWLYDWASLVSEQLSSPELYINAMKSLG